MSAKSRTKGPERYLFLMVHLAFGPWLNRASLDCFFAPYIIGSSTVTLGMVVPNQKPVRQVKDGVRDLDLTLLYSSL